MSKFTTTQALTFSEEMSKFLNLAMLELSSSLDYQTTLKNISKLTVPKLADWFTIEILNEQGTFDLLTVNHVDPKKVKWALELRKTQKTDMNTPRGGPQVVRTGKSEIYPDISDELLVRSARNEKELVLLRKIAFRSMMIVPLTARGKTFGTMNFISTTESNRHYTTEDLKLAEHFARLAAVTLENSLLYKSVRDELEKRIQTEQRLELAQKAGNIGTFEWNLPSRTLIASPELEALYGLNKGEMNAQNKSWLHIVHPEDQERVKNLMYDELFQKGEIEFDFRVVKPNEKIHWLYTKAKVISGTDDKKSRVVGINMDITERKTLERQKDEFLSIASHELKTPITSIKAFVQILQKYFSHPGNERSATFLKKMDNQVDKLTKLVQDLLDVSKIQTGKLEYMEEVFHFDETIQEIIEEMQPLTSTHKITHKKNADVKVLGDKYRVGQVMRNLLSNAIKYSPEGDKIIVSTSFDTNEVTVSVQDFGIGIPKDKQAKLFERFYRVSDKKRASFPGLGLGLYISNEIIKRQHGRMWFTSEEGIGATFYFCIPIHLHNGKKHLS